MLGRGREVRLPSRCGPSANPHRVPGFMSQPPQSSQACSWGQRLSGRNPEWPIFAPCRARAHLGALQGGHVHTCAHTQGPEHTRRWGTGLRPPVVVTHMQREEVEWGGAEGVPPLNGHPAAKASGVPGKGGGFLRSCGERSQGGCPGVGIPAQFPPTPSPATVSPAPSLRGLLPSRCRSAAGLPAHRLAPDWTLRNSGLNEPDPGTPK